MARFLIIAAMFCSFFLTPSCKKSGDNSYQCPTVSKVIGFSASGKAFGIPTALTPNGDGRNDGIRGAGDTSLFKVFSITIKTIDGVQVFSTNSANDIWLGTNSSGKISGGEYVLYYNVTLHTSSTNDTSITGSACIRSFTEVNAQGCLKAVVNPDNYTFADQIDPADGLAKYNTSENFCQ